MSCFRILVILFGVFLFSNPGFAADGSGGLNLSTYGSPGCPAHYKLASGACAPVAAEIQTLTTAKECSGDGLTFSEGVAGAPGTCAASKTAPTPACTDLPGYASKLANGACTYSKEGAGSSSIGDYIGDCFGIRAKVDGTDLRPDAHYVASDQKNLDNDDRQLTLLDAGNIGPLCYILHGGTSHQVTASKLAAAGASRLGWAYGVLTMPYKYYPSKKTFSVNAPIGGYMGFRFGQVGSGYTAAGAFTLSSVKANTVDPDTMVSGQPKVTGSTDVAALSLAVGMMVDVLKSPRGKPFKAGIFMGQDRVSKSPTVSYPQNGKWWFALQIGYDFTDN